MKDKITCTDLMNYCYCPRIIYFVHTLKQPQTKSIKQIKGIEKELLFKKNTKRNKIIKKGPLIRKVYNKTLQTEEFITKVDCIIFNDLKKTAYPLQLKYSYKPKKIYKTQLIQLLFESFLIEKTTNKKSPFGFILYKLSNKLLKINLEDKKELFIVINKVKRLIESEKFPDSTNYKNKCIDCCYRGICDG